MISRSFVDAFAAIRLIRIYQSTDIRVSAHCQTPGLWREHVPHAVIVPEEKESNRAFRPLCLNAYIAPPIRACVTESDYANRRRKGWPQPFFNRQTQGLFRAHALSLQRRSHWSGRSLPQSRRQSSSHKNLAICVIEIRCKPTKSLRRPSGLYEFLIRYAEIALCSPGQNDISFTPPPSQEPSQIPLSEHDEQMRKRRESEVISQRHRTTEAGNPKQCRWDSTTTSLIREHAW